MTLILRGLRASMEAGAVQFLPNGRIRHHSADVPVKETVALTSLAGLLSGAMMVAAGLAGPAVAAHTPLLVK
ncbi:hypothetical protein N866_00250 [Actinotalea ferrariae CF5-4]|uniref:Uncharacterized protein n=1 Tax=Actinotalea ferrariae CF5-4 TaxID=948458 RepID=A0A021VZ59_9CELL|nr:hypothetical protein [Actinotalea ferrariae]EYR65315.1 hypothetical protein N866_00250 [Actinotalea ferrariae CF5-4]